MSAFFTDLELPGPVSTFLAAEQAKDTEKLVLCFAEDALVHDEDRDYRGLEAIRGWKQAAEARYQYVLEPLAASVREQSVTLHARLTGTFPGSPVEVDYTFTLANDKITSLKIH